MQHSIMLHQEMPAQVMYDSLLQDDKETCSIGSRCVLTNKYKRASCCMLQKY